MQIAAAPYANDCSHSVTTERVTGNTIAVAAAVNSYTTVHMFAMKNDTNNRAICIPNPLGTLAR